MNHGDLVARVRDVRDWMLENADSGACANAVNAHLKGWDTDEKIESWISLYRTGISAAIPGFEGSLGIDFGCWTGLGTWVLSTMGAKCVFGVEINRDTMRFGPRWAKQFNLDTVRFAWNAGGVIPMPSNAVDWVYVNQVFCNMRPDGFEQATSEIARVIRSGGTLVFCDSNNPHCPDTIERLERVYRTRELGNGDESNPAGVLFSLRVRRIREMAPELEPHVVQRLAKNTCYLGGPEFDQAVRAFLHAGVEPASPFIGGWEKAPVNPLSGIAAGNVTDPFWFAGRFDALGMDVSINTSPSPGPTDPAQIHDLLTQSQGFYIIATKR